MKDIGILRDKLRDFGRRQAAIDIAALLVFTGGTVLVSLTAALVLLKSPLWCLIGLFPLLFFRPGSLKRRAKYLEKKTGLAGAIVNSLELARIPADSRERYSPELIDAAIAAAVQKIAPVDFRRFLSFAPLKRAGYLLLVTIGLSLIYPALCPGRFWFSLHPLIPYRLAPIQGRYLKGTEVPVRLTFYGPYVPRRVWLVADREGRLTREQLPVGNGEVLKKFVLDENLSGYFEFFNRRRARFALTVIQPLYVYKLRFRLKYPAYTGLAEDTVSGRELVAPTGTRIVMTGRASQPLDSARLEARDTLRVACLTDSFAREFPLTENGTAVLHLFAGTECKEPLTLYAVPDLPPLVDIFYPGDNINMPPEMKLTVAIRASDDYRLNQATFYYNFKKDYARELKLRKTAEDTIYFQWDLDELGLLPGDQICTSRGSGITPGIPRPAGPITFIFPPWRKCIRK